jgi:hypothetical protein
MNATLMKRLFQVIQSGSSADVDALCRRFGSQGRRISFSTAARFRWPLPSGGQAIKKQGKLDFANFCVTLCS